MRKSQQKKSKRGGRNHKRKLTVVDVAGLNHRRFLTITSSCLGKVKLKQCYLKAFFRMNNEKLYTCTGDEALHYLEEDPSLFNMTPVESSSVDVAVFCLSLVETNFPSYRQEAKRFLKPRGWLLIVEVKSRLDSSTGGADPEKFVKAISELGFPDTSKDFFNKMFILFFQKKETALLALHKYFFSSSSEFLSFLLEKQKPKEIRWHELKACIINAAKFGRLLKDKKANEKFEFDPSKATAFDTCNDIWKMIKS